MADFVFKIEEYQILDDHVEFDEEIQRPEKIRFYTLEEQVEDVYERFIPAGRITKYQRDKIRLQVDRIYELYNQYIVPTETDYGIRGSPYGKNLDWVYPIIATTEYNNTDFKPLFRLQDDAYQPNFYSRFLAGLPKPYGNSNQGVPYNIQKPEVFISNERNRKYYIGLPDITVTRTQVHEDRTISIIKDKVEGTADIVKFIGYFLKKRPYDLPNPLAEHPFLKANEDSEFFTTAPLEEVYPSIQAIMTHAVPVTTDVYGEGQRILKIYDVQLSQVPWQEWKNRFPPVEVIPEVPPVEAIAFPKTNEVAPPEKIIEAYKSSYSNGISARKWLMNQLDGGELMIRMLSYDSLNLGSVNDSILANLPELQFNEVPEDQCTLMGLNFQDFTTHGVFRRTWTTEKDKKTKEEFEVVKLRCIPVDTVQQQQIKEGFMNRKTWNEKLPEELSKQYVRVLASYTPIGEGKLPEVKYEKAVVTEDSPLHDEVNLILQDKERLPEDKLKDINQLLKDGILDGKIYKDKEARKVICTHHISLLEGNLIKDKNKFFDEWTARVNGFRVCKFCGEDISTEDFALGDDFDENGNVIKRAEVLEEDTFQGDELKIFSVKLSKLRALFDLNNPHDDMVFMILSILQVLPTSEFLIPLLQFGKEVCLANFKQPDNERSRKFHGYFGVVTSCILLQTHIPTLIPTRSFGSRPLKLDGFPRDNPTPSGYTIADTMVMVINKTFKSFPSTLTSASKDTIRDILNKPKEARTIVTKSLMTVSPLMKLPAIQDLFRKARDHIGKNPPAPEQPRTLIPVMPPPETMNKVFQYECPINRPILTSSVVPRVRQAEVPLRSNMRATSKASYIQPSMSERTEVQSVDKKDIQKLVKSAPTKSVIQMTQNYRTNMALASRLSDLFFLNTPIESIDPSQKESELLDYSKGILANVLNQIYSSSTMKTKLEKYIVTDITLYSLVSTYGEEMTEVRKTKAAERMKFVERMGLKSDMEREIDNELLGLGLAPYIYTREDRQNYAAEAERLQNLLRFGIGEEDNGPDVVVRGENEEIDDENVDQGDYGDNLVLPNNEGRDPQQDFLNSDERSSI